MSKRKGSFLLLGAFIGFIAGLFLAPKKGSELRKDAKNKIDEIKENPKEVLQGTFEDVKGKINDFIDAYLSKHPLFPQVHSIPSFTIVICPNSNPEYLAGSNNLPSKNAAPPTPVPILTNTQSS